MGDLDDFARPLLAFAEQTLEEAIEDPVSRDALLAEARGAVLVLKGTLRREDQTRFTSALLAGLFEIDLRNTDTDPEGHLRTALEELRSARPLLW